MNRVEIKNKAKEMIKGNKWYLLKPIFGFIVFAIALYFVILLIFAAIKGFNVDQNEVTFIYLKSLYIYTFVIFVFGTVFSVCYAKYTMAFVRNKKVTFNEILHITKNRWILFILVSVLVYLMVFVGSILLVVPGIIIAVGYMFYQEVCADNIEAGVIDIIKKSWNITKNNKADLFLLILSFVGWIILAELTLGILYIWLLPYMNVTLVLTYEKIK